MVVEVNERVNFLDEVVISPENTEKFLDLKEEEFKKVDYLDDKSTAVENEIIRQNQLYRGINIVNIAKLLAKVISESKMEQEIKLTPSKALPLVFDNNFFIISFVILTALILNSTDEKIISSPTRAKISNSPFVSVIVLF